MALTQVSTGGIKDGHVHTADLADAQITAGKLHADALDHTYTLGASGSDHYTFTGEGLTGAVNDPTLYLTRGKTYRFVNGNSSGAHPFRIQSVAGAGGTEYNTGVTNNAGGGGSTIIFEVPHDAPDVLYYICTSHATMNGIFYVTGALADGTVTTAKLADDAVTNAKIGVGAVSETELSNNCVTNAKVGDNAINTAEIAADAITGAKIADDAVDNEHIANDAVRTLQIINNAVNDSKIADSAVTTAKINDGAVTDAKINGMAASKLTGDLPAISGANLTGIQGIPSGVIMLWSGASNAIPTGFVLCDGNNSTPDLRNRFVVGATDTYSVGATGGATTDTVNISISGQTGTININGENSYKFSSSHPLRKNHDHSFSGSGSDTVNTLPPYYALCYIMKT